MNSVTVLLAIFVSLCKYPYYFCSLYISFVLFSFFFTQNIRICILNICETREIYYFLYYLVYLMLFYFFPKFIISSRKSVIFQNYKSMLICIVLFKIHLELSSGIILCLRGTFDIID